MTDSTNDNHLIPDNAKTPQQSRYGRRTLWAMSRSGQHVYAGTVPYGEKKRRRAKDKVAKQSRKKNR